MNFPSERILRIAIAVIAAVGIGVATYIFIADSTAGAPACLVGGGGCETVAKSSYSHIAGINIAIFGIIGWILILATVFFANDVGAPGRVPGGARRLRLQHLPDLPRDLEDRSDLPVVRGQRGPDDDRASCLNTTRLLGYVGTDTRTARREELRGPSPKTA